MKRERFTGLLLFSCLSKEGCEGEDDKEKKKSTMLMIAASTKLCLQQLKRNNDNIKLFTGGKYVSGT